MEIILQSVRVYFAFCSQFVMKSLSTHLDNEPYLNCYVITIPTKIEKAQIDIISIAMYKVIKTGENCVRTKYSLGFTLKVRTAYQKVLLSEIT